MENCSTIAMESTLLFFCLFFFLRVVNFNTLIKFKWIAMTVISDDSLQIHFDIQNIHWEP